MRLPTEAEWEYAAQGGNPMTRYGAPDEVGWHSENSGGKTNEAGRKQPNGYGLYDMLGNVWEWVGDWYDANDYASSPATDPQGPSERKYRALRGCSWLNSPRSVHVSFRFRFVPEYRGYSFGVRCVGN
jgi:formylglycine-generating enzyme required for sulfatase activity